MRMDAGSAVLRRRDGRSAKLTRVPVLGRLKAGGPAPAPLDPEAEAIVESRLVWILGSPRTGSTWLLRMLMQPWRLAGTASGYHPISSVRRGGPPIVPINESHIPNHITPQKVPRYVAGETPGPEQFLGNTKRANDPHYFFSHAFADVWRRELRRLILARFHAQAARSTGSADPEGPPIVIKEPNGSHGAQLMMDLLPRGRIVFLMRDGRDVVDSQLALRIPGGARAEGHRRAEPVATHDKRLGEVLRNSRLWVNSMSAVQAAYDAQPPELRYLLRYEDLRRDTFEELRALREWLGLPSADGVVRAAVEAEAFESLPDSKKGFGQGARAAEPGHWRKTLTGVEQRVAEDVMADKLVELGYPVGKPADATGNARARRPG